MSTREFASATRKHQRAMVFALTITAIYMVVQVVGGIFTNSLALLTDAGHMLTDVLGMAMALLASWFAQKAPTSRHSFGFYRAEILAALANALVLFVVSGAILLEAWKRFWNPPAIEAPGMLAIACVGLVTNVLCAWLLHKGSKGSLKLKDAYLEVLSDLFSSVGVILASIIILLTGWTYIDPLVSLGIGLLIIPRIWKLLMAAVHVLLEGTPTHINLNEVRQELEEFPEVLSVHDLHIWTITASVHSLSAHIRVTGKLNPADLLTRINRLLAQRFQILHTTIQLEPFAYEHCNQPD